MNTVRVGNAEGLSEAQIRSLFAEESEEIISVHMEGSAALVSFESLDAMESALMKDGNEVEGRILNIEKHVKAESHPEANAMPQFLGFGSGDKPNTDEKKEPDVVEAKGMPQLIGLNPEPKLSTEEKKPDAVEAKGMPQLIGLNPEPKVSTEEKKPDVVEAKGMPQLIGLNLEPKVSSEAKTVPQVDNEPDIIAESHPVESNAVPQLLGFKSEPKINTEEKKEPEVKATGKTSDSQNDDLRATLQNTTLPAMAKLDEKDPFNYLMNQKTMTMLGLGILIFLVVSSLF